MVTVVDEEEILNSREGGRAPEMGLRIKLRAGVTTLEVAAPPLDYSTR